MATATLTQTSSSSKKRKQPPTEADASYENAGPSVHKKSKKDKKHKKSKHSGEHKSKQSKSAKSVVDDRREFNVLQASLVVSLAPVFSANPHAGVEEMLDSMVMRYVPAFKGVVLTHSNLHFLQSNGTIQGDCPYVSCHVTFDATVWSPVVGMQLSARVNLCSPDHIALLIHETFNVSIPKHHIPLDEWEFQYGPAENDPLYGSGSGVEALSLEENHEKMDVDVNVDVEPTTSLSKPEEAEKETEAPESMGDWVRRASGDPIGGKDRKLTFTVVGLTIANEMLSLVGSIQSDPFSPDHVPDPADVAATAAAAAKSARAGSVISEDSDAEWANVPPPAAVPSEDDDEDDGEDDEFDPADAMAILQKLRANADKDKANKVKAAKVVSAPALPPAAVEVGEGNGDKAEKKKRKKEKSKPKTDAATNGGVVVAEKKKKEKKQEKFKSKEMIDDDEDDKD